MTAADQLRQALNSGWDSGYREFRRSPNQTDRIDDAARCWLRLQEADEAVIRKVAKAIMTYENGPFDVNGFNYEAFARAVLAAITEEKT